MRCRDGQGGASVRLEFTREPELGPWMAVGAGIQVLIGRAVVTDTDALTDVYRFYRVVRP